MIEISHAQARRLIRSAADSELPEAQWALLQAHLEGCAECRAYRDRQDALQHALRHSLRQRWSRVEMSRQRQRMAGLVIAARERRGRRLRYFARAGLGLVAAAVLIALFISSRAANRAAQARHAQTQAAGVSNVTAIPPSPTPVRSFQGVVALTQTVAGKLLQIFLLNAAAGRSAAPELTNLTGDSSQNTTPAWSPDGEWLAFLSDRGGRAQLYVMNVAGTRLTQLTNSPGIQWQGPISWSYNGQWIALAGRRDQDNATWIYAVPVTPAVGGGPGPRAISGTRGTTGWSRFSPSQPLLAVQRADGGIDVYNSELGWSGEVTRAARLTQGLRTAQAGAFTWALGGLRLVYLADGPYVQGPATGGVSNMPRALADATTQIIISQVIGPYVHPAALDANQGVLSSTPGAGSFRSLAYQPGGPLLATLRDVHQTGCWTVYALNMVLFPRVPALDDPGLCVLNRLDSSAWTPDGRWLVVIARPENAAHQPSGAAGLYALNVSSGVFERLSDEPLGGFGAIAVRGAGPALDIQPIPPQYLAQDAAQEASPGPPQGITGKLVYSESYPLSSAGALRSAIVRINPDGTDRQVLVAPDSNNTCPVLSPDGRQIAFLSDRDDPTRQKNVTQPEGGNGQGLNEIFVIDANGSYRQITFPEVPYSAALTQPAYDCPVWSPDGKLIAAVFRSGQLPRLNIFQTDGQLLRSITIDPPSRLTSPVWSPDGSKIYLADPAVANGQGRRSSYTSVASVTWRLPTGTQTLLGLPGWDDIQALSISPDGLRIALLVVSQANQENGNRSRAALEIYHLADLSRQYEMTLSLTDYDPQAAPAPNRLIWSANDQITLLVPRGPFARKKALLLRFDNGGNMYPLAEFDNAVYGWTLFENWIVAGTEGGLYGVHIPESTDEPALAPMLLDSNPVTALDGR